MVVCNVTGALVAAPRTVHSCLASPIDSASSTAQASTAQANAGRTGQRTELPPTMMNVRSIGPFIDRTERRSTRRTEADGGLGDGNAETAPSMAASAAKLRIVNLMLVCLGGTNRGADVTPCHKLQLLG